jgi:hypothetical protein
MLEALKQIDNMIEERMDGILTGLQLLNYNALSISENLDNIHKKVIINLDKTSTNVSELKSNQKRLE